MVRLTAPSFTELAALAGNDGDRERILAAARDYGSRIYGTEAAVDPYSGYEGKAGGQGPEVSGQMSEIKLKDRRYEIKSGGTR